MTKREFQTANEEFRKILRDSIPSPRKPGDPLIFYPVEKLAGWASLHGLRLLKDIERLRRQNKSLKARLKS